MPSPRPTELARRRHLLTVLASGFALSLLSAQPAGAHGLASGGAAAGALHPLLGLDHLLLLLGVGLAGSCLQRHVWLWALAGGLGGGIIAAAGGSLPNAELLAALAVSLIGGLILLGQRRALPRLALGAAVGLTVGLHALLHGLAGGSTAGWWLGGLASALALMACGAQLGQRLPQPWTSGLALGLVVGGGLQILPVMVG